MLSRPRLMLFRFSIFISLVLLGLAFFLPPDGKDHWDFAQFLGRFHPLIIHIPIAFLLLALIFEFAGLSQRRSALRQSSEFVLALAAISAVCAAILGWLLAWSGAYEGDLVRHHMWGGVSLAIASMACYWLFRWNRVIAVLGLLATVGLMAWTSDQGGKLTHGSEYLTEHMPAPMREFLGVSSTQTLDVDPKSFYATRVHPIFTDKCVTCHSADKHKGGLRLDNYAEAMQGGKDGKVIQPGDTSKSDLFRRITLPSDSKSFMPSEGKPPLTADEIKVIEVWITAGAAIEVDNKLLAGLPAVQVAAPPELQVADYHPQLKTINALESSLGIRLVPRSQKATDGLILRTFSAPEACNDQTLAQLAPVADLIVDAELARTKVTDAGISTLTKNFSNLRFLDLSSTAVTSASVKDISRLDKLESLNLSGTKVDASAAADLHAKPNLKKLYLPETN